MSDKSKAPVWFWIVAILFFLWNLTGVWNYINQMTMSEEALAALSETIKAQIENRPSWATAAFAIAVWGGAIASLLLLLRKSVAFLFFLVSLAGVVVNMIAGFFVIDAVVTGEQKAFAFIVLVVAIIPLWITRMASSKGWIN